MTSDSFTLVTAQDFQRLLGLAQAEPDFVWLGSHADSRPETETGRFSMFSARADSYIRLDPQHAASGPGLSDDVTRRMQAVMDKYSRPEPNVADNAVNAFAPESGLPFTGGWIGYISYEYGYLHELRLAALCPDLPCPILNAGFFLWAAIHDRELDQHWLFIHSKCARKTQNWIQESRVASSGVPSPAPWKMTRPFTPNQQQASYLGRVERVKDYIQAGDCYQANLSQRFSGRYQGDPWAGFQALSQANPTPFSAYIRAGDYSLLSLSPERFLTIQDSVVTTSPIKGTRPRGSTSEQDRAYADELQASEKDRAENLMIVDLLRNDLGLNCKTGSVRVDKLFALESYRNVHHLVSHIRGELKPGFSPLRALLDAFPGGSITGAPKIRAMEIIRELEPHWRGPYCGSVFYWSLNGRLDSSIAIRTLLCDNQGNAWCWGGGGIVADSDPQAEYEETLTKVRPLMAFLESLELP